MNKKSNAQIFYWYPFAASAVAIVGFDVAARLIIGKESLIHATYESLYYLVTQPVGAFLLILPFGVVGMYAKEAAHYGKFNHGWIQLAFGVCPLEYIYFKGNMNAQYMLEQEKWTASAMSVGMLPFLSVPVLAISLLLGWVVIKIIEKKT